VRRVCWLPNARKTARDGRVLRNVRRILLEW
jgi:hypothetical protein